MSDVLELPRRPYTTVHQAHVGDTHTWFRVFYDEDIQRTGVATRDHNPVHFSAAYATKTRFKRPVLHGVATLGEISRALDMDFPGRGTIFVSLVAQFKRPIYPGDRVDFNTEIIEVLPQWAKLVIRITATVGGRPVLTAGATVVLENDLV